MSIVDLQRSIREAGRIRIGEKASGGRPSKLETFRLTSADRLRIEQAAAAFGGTVSAWDAPAGKQWQVTTERDALDVIVPPSDLSFSQSYELWSAGGCQRRCDGVTEQLTQGPCLCDPEQRECTPHTRLSVLLPDLPGLGVWRLDSQGWYAARELAGVVELLVAAAGRGALLPARLRLEQRTVKRQVDGRAQTRRFAVPVLDVEISPAQLLDGAQPLELASVASPPLTPVPALPAPSIAAQVQPPEPPAPRANGAADIRPSGRRRAARATQQPADGPVEDEAPLAPGTDQTAASASATDHSPAASPERSPLEAMLKLVRDSGRDPDALLAALGYTDWSQATDRDIETLTSKAREALLNRATAVATSTTEA